MQFYFAAIADDLAAIKEGNWPNSALRLLGEHAFTQAVGNAMPGGHKCYGIVVVPSKVMIHTRHNGSYARSWSLPSRKASGEPSDLCNAACNWLTDLSREASGAVSFDVQEIAVGLKMEHAVFGAFTCMWWLVTCSRSRRCHWEGELHARTTQFILGIAQRSLFALA